jgi:hypothetical protein
MSITALSRYGIADASIVPLLANARLTRQHLKAMFFHETYQLLRMKSTSRFIRRSGTAALSAARTRMQVALAMAFGCPSFNVAGR